MTRTNSEDLALLVLNMAKAVGDDLNIVSDSDLAKDCRVARELAIRVLGDHIVQEVLQGSAKVEHRNARVIPPVYALASRSLYVVKCDDGTQAHLSEGVRVEVVTKYHTESTSIIGCGPSTYIVATDALDLRTLG